MIKFSVVRYRSQEVVLLRADLLPIGGIKHFIGFGLVQQAFEQGRLSGDTKAVVVQGGGNTALAVNAAIDRCGLSAKVIAVVYAETSERSLERLRSNGVEVIANSPRAEGRDGRLSRTQKLCQREGFVLLEQHENPVIILIQADAFRDAIRSQCAGRSPTHLVAGVGTGGTLFGIESTLPRTSYVRAVEGVGSTLTLWHAYAHAQREKADFGVEKAAIEAALGQYRKAGMLTELKCCPNRPHDEWFDVSIDFPGSVTGVVGIEGLGVGDPTQLISSNLRRVDDVQIVTDGQAEEGVALLAEQGISAVSSAGANFYTAMELAKHMQDSTNQCCRILTVVTAKAA